MKQCIPKCKLYHYLMLLFLNIGAILIHSKPLNSPGKMANPSRLFHSFRIRATLYLSFWNWNQFFFKQRDILMIESMNSLSRRVPIRSEVRSTEYFQRNWHRIPFLCFLKKWKYFSKKVWSLLSGPSVLITTMNINIWSYWHFYSQDTMFWMEWRAFGAYRAVLRCSRY